MKTYERNNPHVNKDGTPDKRFRKGKDHPNYNRRNNPLQIAAGIRNYVLGFVIQRIGGNTLAHLRQGNFYVSARTRKLCCDIDNLSLELKESVKTDYEKTKELIIQNEGK